MTTNKVVVSVTDEPPKGVELKVEGVTLTGLVLSNDDWDQKASQLKPGPTKKVIDRLRSFTGIASVKIEPKNDYYEITIRCDSSRQSIEDSVAAALQAELKSLTLPAPRIRERGLRRRYSDFLASLRD